MKRTDKEKMFNLENTSVIKELDFSRTSDQLGADYAKSLKTVPLGIRRKEAVERLYLDRYE